MGNDGVLDYISERRKTLRTQQERLWRDIDIAHRRMVEALHHAQKLVRFRDDLIHTRGNRFEDQKQRSSRLDEQINQAQNDADTNHRRMVSSFEDASYARDSGNWDLGKRRAAEAQRYREHKERAWERFRQLKEEKSRQWEATLAFNEREIARAKEETRRA